MGITIASLKNQVSFLRTSAVVFRREMNIVMSDTNMETTGSHLRKFDWYEGGLMFIESIVAVKNT
jgi:hypothetical protein